jgi:transposase
MKKSLLDAAHGQFMQLLEDKSKIQERCFERLKPNSDKHPVTRERIAPSKMCPVCDHKNLAQKDLNNKDFKCENCEFTHENRDCIPGINFTLWAYFEGKATGEQLSKEAASILRLRRL